MDSPIRSHLSFLLTFSLATAHQQALLDHRLSSNMSVSTFQPYTSFISRSSLHCYHMTNKVDTPLFPTTLELSSCLTVPSSLYKYLCCSLSSYPAFLHNYELNPCQKCYWACLDLYVPLLPLQCQVDILHHHLQFCYIDVVSISLLPQLSSILSSALTPPTSNITPIAMLLILHQAMPLSTFGMCYFLLTGSSLFISLMISFILSVPSLTQSSHLIFSAYITAYNPQPSCFRVVTHQFPTSWEQLLLTQLICQRLNLITPPKHQLSCLCIRLQLEPACCCHHPSPFSNS